MRFFLGVLSALAMLVAFPAWAAQLQGKVIAVTDGDTIKVLDAGLKTHVIRLLGIDAPERKQPFGQQSRRHLSGLVFGQQVIVEWQLKDRDGRILGKVLASPTGCLHCEPATDVNLAQVSSGHAWWYRQFARNQTAPDRVLYEHAEREAQRIHIGLWVDDSPIPPWEWRKGRRD